MEYINFVLIVVLALYVLKNKAIGKTISEDKTEKNEKDTRLEEIERIMDYSMNDAYRSKRR